MDGFEPRACGQPVEGIYVQQPFSKGTAVFGMAVTPFVPEIAPTGLSGTGPQRLVLPGARDNPTGQQNEQPGQALNYGGRPPKVLAVQFILAVQGQPAGYN